MKNSKILLLGSGALMASFMLSACESDNITYNYPEYQGNGRYSSNGENEEKLFGKDGIVLFGGDKEDENSGGAGIGVNSFLWRGTLDTIGFMPLASADPFGGVIITDWYSPPATPDERFKINAFILSKSLRADAVRINVFKQVKKKGVWQDAKVPENASTSIEDAILVKARELRIATQPKK